MGWENDVILVALGEVGMQEGERDDNKYGRDYGSGWNHQPYCGMGLSWCRKKAGHPLPEMQAPGYSGFASAQIGLDYIRQHKQIITDPRPGDFVFFDWQNDGHVDHVELLIAINPDGHLVTIGFNTGSPQGCHVRIRERKNVIFGRVPPIDRGGPCWNNNSCPV